MRLHVCSQFSCQMHIHGLLLALSASVGIGEKKENWSVFDLTNEAGDVASLTWGFLYFLRNSLFKNKNPNLYNYSHSL